MPGLRRLLDPRRGAAALRRARRQAREPGVRVGHRLRGALPVLHEHLRVHSIHGRAPAVATGVGVARPDLDVWVIGGDGDMLSIGGNHLIHALRRNVNLKILMFNNQIYGLTKGQYSPTSEVGKVTKSTPFGSLDHPFNPISVALGAEATFVARTHDMDRKHMMEMFRRGARAPGRGVRRGVPELQRLQRRRVRRRSPPRTRAPTCSSTSSTVSRSASAPTAQHGVVLNEFGECEIVDVADVGEDRLLVHDEHRADPTLAFALVASRRPARRCPRRSACSATSSARRTRSRCSASSSRRRSARAPATSPALLASGADLGRRRLRRQASSSSAEHHAGAGLGGEESRLLGHALAGVGGGADVGHRRPRGAGSPRRRRPGGPSPATSRASSRYPSVASPSTGRTATSNRAASTEWRQDGSAARAAPTRSGGVSNVASPSPSTRPRTLSARIVASNAFDAVGIVRPEGDDLARLDEGGPEVGRHAAGEAVDGMHRELLLLQLDDERHDRVDAGGAGLLGAVVAGRLEPMVPVGEHCGRPRRRTPARPRSSRGRR